VTYTGLDPFLRKYVLSFFSSISVPFGLSSSGESGETGEAGSRKKYFLRAAALPNLGHLAFLEVVWHFNFSFGVFLCLICFWHFIWLFRSCLAFFILLAFLAFIWLFGTGVNVWSSRKFKKI
jgi:hypothetical protein